jgi:predicted nucleic acid-binding Zn finger protein
MTEVYLLKREYWNAQGNEIGDYVLDSEIRVFATYGKAADFVIQETAWKSAYGASTAKWIDKMNYIDEYRETYEIIKTEIIQ